MDVRVVESIGTQGGLRDIIYRVLPEVETVSLNWDPTTGFLAVVDYNLNYAPLPWELYGDMVKKVFLVKNTKDCGTGAITETVMVSSAPSSSVDFLPGYNNSNEWSFAPSRGDIDNWYTSYVCTARTWETVDPPLTGSSMGHILFHIGTQKFYVNLTGSGGSLIGGAPDTVNWAESPSYDQWKIFMKMYMGDAMVSDPLYFIETQHVVTVELNNAILSEIKKMCGCCTSPKFNTSKVNLYMKLAQKRLGIWTKFNQFLYQDAACIIETTRSLCAQCLYNKDYC